MKTITLYYSPVQQMLHTIEAEVKEDSTHKVVESTIVIMGSAFSLPRHAHVWAKVVGEANVRAYYISEASF